MNEKSWNLIRENTNLLSITPVWARETLKLEFKEVVNLSELGEASNRHNLRPHIEIKTIDPSYLDFLREQIRLKPRGDDWNVVLNRRLCALESHVGKEVLFALFIEGNENYTLTLGLENEGLIHEEIY